MYMLCSIHKYNSLLTKKKEDSFLGNSIDLLAASLPSATEFFTAIFIYCKN